MKKSMLVALIALLVLAFAVSLVSAAPPAVRQNQPCAQAITLTDAQKLELAPLFNQMMDIRKQILQKLVTDGTITQADADQRAAWMQERMNDRMGNGMIGGPGMGRGHGRMGFGHGKGSRGQ